MSHRIYCDHIIEYESCDHLIQRIIATVSGQMCRCVAVLFLAVWISFGAHQLSVTVAGPVREEAPCSSNLMLKTSRLSKPFSVTSFHPHSS
jgi:hypothetical protein